MFFMRISMGTMKHWASSNIEIAEIPKTDEITEKSS